MIWMWTKGVAAARPGALAMAAAGIVAATALIGVIGVFGVTSARTMTQRSMTAVPVDWQVVIANGADATALTEMLPASAAIRAARTVGYADVAALVAKTADTTQTTGAGQALGLPADYAVTFPGQMRALSGRTSGVLLAQQTAANLHVAVGDIVTVRPEGADAFDVTIDGIVDLPNANAMFQTIGPAKGPSATAPPDNIVLLPWTVWNEHFAKAARAASGGARIQIHVAIDRASLPASPDDAYRVTAGKARNFEVRAAGSAIIGDNLSTRLGAVRQDALFARMLLLFLGLPGIVLASLLTASIARADSGRRRRETALLGLRGAGVGRMAALASVEAGFVAVTGSLCGMALAAFIAGAALGIDLRDAETLLWLVASGSIGFAIALAVVLAPALGELRSRTTVARRAWLDGTTTFAWRKLYLDVGLILLAGAIFWRSASTGYQVVLAPEGVAATAIDYTAFLAPLFLWIGSGLLALHLTSGALRAGRATLKTALAPLVGRLANPVAAALSRQNRRVAAGVALVALAVAFAVATSTFNTTYNAQLRVDAQLTNGADVTVTGAAATPAGAFLDQIRAVAGVAAAEPMQHRFAYVGKDLQDLYGVDPARIAKATSIADAFFANGDAKAALAKLATTPDGVLVSQETMNDFQLTVGDTVNLRLQDARDHQYKTVPFHFIGVVKEFPTAPRDSFLVANANYVAAQTGDTGAEIVLARASGDPSALAVSIRAALGATNLKTTDISQAAHLIGSSLTAVDLHGLGAVELVFAVLFVAMATGLTLWLGRSERARANAILLSLGASHSDIRSFLWSEGLVMLGAGFSFGAPIGAVAAWMLVRLLGGVFDPPPEALSIPFSYLALVLCGAILATVAAVMAQGHWSNEWAARELRAGR